MKGEHERLYRKLLKLSGEGGFSFAHFRDNKVILGDVITNLDEHKLEMAGKNQLIAEQKDIAEFMYCLAMTYLVTMKNLLNVDCDEFMKILNTKIAESKYIFENGKSRPGFKIKKIIESNDNLQ
jgi:hypothetical protein